MTSVHSLGGKGQDEEDSQGPAESSRSVISLIRDLKNGALVAAAMSIKDRRLCVAHLTAEGYSIPEIAEILKTGERTIFRDRAAIRQANAVAASPELTSQMVGHLLSEADTSISRIRRATRGSSATTMEKIDGERSCWVITKELIQSLQRLGFLPTAPQQIQGQLTHQFREIEAPGYDDLEQELERLAGILSSESGQQAVNGQPAVMDEIVQVKDTITRLTLSRQIQLLSSQVTPDPPAPPSLPELDDGQSPSAPSPPGRPMFLETLPGEEGTDGQEQ